MKLCESQVLKSNLWKITSFSNYFLLQMELFLTMLFTIKSSPLLVSFKLNKQPVELTAWLILKAKAQFHLLSFLLQKWHPICVCWDADHYVYIQGKVLFLTTTLKIMILVDRAWAGLGKTAIIWHLAFKVMSSLPNSEIRQAFGWW